MTVVHCRKARYTHYIGRPSVFGNPFSHLPASAADTIVASREDAICRFEDYARSTPAVLAAIKALPEDAVLGCWCKPKSCHGDVIVRLRNEPTLPF